MCAIVGSFDKETLLKLIKLNSYRGSHSYSFSTIAPDGKLTVHVKNFGNINPDDITIEPGHYAIVHVQAPTTEARSTSNIHPAQEQQSALWHNGIIKAIHVKKMQATFGNDTDWDTQLLLRAVSLFAGNLNDVDGSFSCLMVSNNQPYLFRNEISPMFYDKDMNISSTKFDSSNATPPNQVLHMDLTNHTLYNIFDFKTVENPYFFSDE